LSPPPDYTASGAFAINLWVKTHTDTDLNGTSFAYVFSHTAAKSRGLAPDDSLALEGGLLSTTASPAGPDQVWTV
jgi:hypothetical protein